MAPSNQTPDRHRAVLNDDGDGAGLTGLPGDFAEQVTAAGRQLAAETAEMVFAAGAGAQLAAVPRFSDFPPQAAALPQIGDASSLDAERILALQPDLVIGWKSGNRAADLARLERLGLKLFVIEPVVLGDVPRALRAIGAAAATFPP